MYQYLNTFTHSNNANSNRLAQQASMCNFQPINAQICISQVHPHLMTHWWHL